MSYIIERNESVPIENLRSAVQRATKRPVKMAKILLWDFHWYQKFFHLRSTNEEDFETTLDRAEEGFQEL